MRRRLIGRLCNYLQSFGDTLIALNDWDSAALRRFLDDPLIGSFAGPIQSAATDAQLEEIAERLIPDAWSLVAATGTPDVCAARISREFDCGVDGVILHGTTPEEIEPILAPYARVRRRG